MSSPTRRALVSTDGTSFAATAQFTFNSTVAQTVYVRGIPDGVEEGPHTSTISHSVSSSTSADYASGTSLPLLVANVVDVDLPPVIGIDFDNGGSVPNNWLQVGSLFDADGADLTRDDGVVTSIDISSTISGNTFRTTSGPSASSIPRHLPSLLDLAGYSYNDTGTSFTSTWSDLTPGERYGVYIFWIRSR